MGDLSSLASVVLAGLLLGGIYSGGVTRSLALDMHGKSLSSLMLGIDLPGT